jgi:hypothetical protein
VRKLGGGKIVRAKQRPRSESAELQLNLRTAFLCDAPVGYLKHCQKINRNVSSEILPPATAAAPQSRACTLAKFNMVNVYLVTIS